MLLSMFRNHAEYLRRNCFDAILPENFAQFQEYFQNDWGGGSFNTLQTDNYEIL